MRISGFGFRVSVWKVRVHGVGFREERVTWKSEFKLPWRKAGLLISMIKWTRTSS